MSSSSPVQPGQERSLPISHGHKTKCKQLEAEIQSIILIHISEWILYQGNLCLVIGKCVRSQTGEVLKYLECFKAVRCRSRGPRNFSLDSVFFAW